MKSMFCSTYPMISILAPLTGSDKTQPCHQTPYAYFNPRSPHRERRVCRDVYAPLIKYFNPRSPHRERPHLFDFKYPWYNISIHAPLTGSDDATNLLNQIINISIHAPLTGSDVYFGLYAGYSADFNPRSPHRERLSRNLLCIPK